MSYHQLSYQGVINNVPEHERDIIIDIVEKLKTNSHVDNSALQRIYYIKGGATLLDGSQDGAARLQRPPL